MNKFDEAIQKQVAKRRKGLVIEEGRHTIGEFIGAVLGITSKRDAKEFYEGYLIYLANHPAEDNPRELTTKEIALSNIGWCFGEGMNPKYIEMWSKVCKASHPVFGNIIPTAGEAYNVGLKCGADSPATGDKK